MLKRIKGAWTKWVAMLWFAGISHAWAGMEQMPMPDQVDTDDSPMGTLEKLINYGGQILLGVLGLATLMMIGWIILKKFREATEKGTWGEFGSTAVIGLVVIVLVAGLIILAYDYVLEA